MTVERLPLSGLQAVVVGLTHSAGPGIALALAEAGADVAAAAASLEGDEVMAAKRVARQAERMGRRSLSQAWDVTLPTNVQVSLRQVVKELGAPRILVYCADLPFERAIERTTDAEFARVQAVNLHGAYYAARSFLRELPEGEPGCLIVMTPEMGEDGRPGFSAYAAAKAGLAGLIRSLASETQERGVTVNAIVTSSDDAAVARAASLAVRLAGGNEPTVTGRIFSVVDDAI